VDDRPEKLLSLEAALEDLDLSIVRAQSGRDALRHLLSGEFAVILIDINMPDMDGFETAQFIRQRRHSAHIPIIFMTAMTDEMHLARSYSLGAVDFILTPVVPQVLRSKVAVFVDLFRKSQQVQMQADRLRQRATQLHRLTSTSLTINSASSVQKIAQIAADTARELIGTNLALMLISPGDHPAHTASCASYSGKHASWQKKSPNLQGGGLFILVSKTNKPMRMTHLELEAHAPAHAISDDTPPLRGLLAAPLTGRDGSNMGAILLSDKMEGEFTDDDQAILVQLSQMASVAVENAIFADERESNRLKDEFLSTLSHELRTPLNAISGWIQLLRMKPLDEETTHGLEVIQRNVVSQTRLIEDLLDLSRITSGKLRVKAKPIEIVRVVEAAVDSLLPVAREKGVAIDCQFDGARGAVVVGDAERLQQVCWNLLSNAVKFTASGGMISVRLARENGMIRLSVTDTGVGIENEFLPFVFDRFRQADSTSSRHHGGLGIGLAIAKHLVELHNGSIRVESEGKDRGATFNVRLPAASITHPQNLNERPDNGDGQGVQSLQNVRVLVVDDEPDTREIITQILCRYHAQVESACGAAEALSRIPSMRPNVVVTDLAMPELDGFALLRELRRLGHEQGGDTPAIALTAYARPEDRARAFEVGFQEHLSKPVDPQELIGTIHRLAVARPELPSTLGMEPEILATNTAAARVS
jgi:signal transduction histidine kinase/DNA-binding response OmpR family regulator